MGIEAAPQMWQTLITIRSNLYQRTRPLKPNVVGNRVTPLDHLRYWHEKMRMFKDWLNRSGFPVSHKHIDGAISALADAIIDLHNNPESLFTPASYGKGADPKNAETLQQFSTFLNKRVSQNPIPHRILTRVAEEWDEFMEEFKVAYKRLLDSGEVSGEL